MEGVADVQRRLTAVFDTRDFQVSVHDGPLAGQEVPHVHIHVIPRTEGDGCKNMLAMWPAAPPMGRRACKAASAMARPSPTASPERLTTHVHVRHPP